jgi:hypothetical protein
LLFVGPALGATGALLGLLTGLVGTAVILGLAMSALGGSSPLIRFLCLGNVALWTVGGAALGLWVAFHQDRDEEPVTAPDAVPAPAPSSTGITGRRPQGRQE